MWTGRQNPIASPNLLQCMSLLLAQSGHPETLNQCPLLGVKRTFNRSPAMSAYDPKRTLASPKSRNGRYGISDHGCLGYSGLMLAARITLPHFSVSSAISLPKSAGEPGSSVAPRSASRALILGSARAALTSLLSFSMMSVGVFLGAPMPNHALTS